MEALDQCEFTAFRWRGGNPRSLFGISLHSGELLKSGARLREYAVGYCKAERLSCRPKPDHMAVMFYIGGRYAWFHLFNPEFDRIFKEVTK